MKTIKKMITYYRMNRDYKRLAKNVLKEIHNN